MAGWRSYLEGVDWTARQAIATTVDLLELFRLDREKISATRACSTLRVYEELQRRVIVPIRRVATASGLSIPTVTAALAPDEWCAGRGHSS